MGQSNSAPTSSSVISGPTKIANWQHTRQKNTISLANAQARPQTINMHKNLQRELNRPNVVASPAAGGSRRKRRNKKTRRHKK